MKKLKVDVGADNTFTKDDLELIICAIESFSNDKQAVKCIRLLKKALKLLRK